MFEADAISQPVLAFDCSAAHCAVALFVGGRIESRVHEMTQGQAESLMPMLDALLQENGIGFDQIGRIGVGIGPGNFTGLRIAVSAARGLAMGLGIPAVGVSGFDAIRHGRDARYAAISAPRDLAYLQRDAEQPTLVSQADVPREAVWPGQPQHLVTAMVEITAEASPERLSKPAAPLYVRPADAAPARDKGPVILDDA